VKTKTWKQYALGILLTQSIGALSGWLSRDGMQIFSASISQPPLSPPAFLFPIVWGVLYALMGIGAARIYLSPQSTERSMALNVYITQLIFNFFWSLIFFNAQAYLFAFFWLLILLFLVLWMILSFLKVDPLSAKLQIPYLLWLSFAAYLNLGVWYLNR